jgi:DNA-binding GntR family transcriptional regulator
LVSAVVDLAGNDNQLALVSDLLAVRRQFAQLVLTRLATKPPADTSTFRDAIHKMEALIEQAAPTAELAAADLHILQCFVAMTDSDVLRLCINPTSTLASQLPVLQSALYASPRITVAAWTALAEWLVSPSVELIPQFMRAIEARDRATLLRLNRAMQA